MSGTKWTAGDVRRVVNNPVYVGIGPFPQILDEDDWIAAQCEMISREGARKTLRHIKTVLNETFPAGVATVSGEAWVEESVDAIKKLGPDAFFRQLISKLRTELKHVPAAETVPVLGYTPASPDRG